jgi:hypothetical protein
MAVLFRPTGEPAAPAPAGEPVSLEGLLRREMYHPEQCARLVFVLDQ